MAVRKLRQVVGDEIDVILIGLVPFPDFGIGRLEIVRHDKHGFHAK